MNKQYYIELNVHKETIAIHIHKKENATPTKPSTR